MAEEITFGNWLRQQRRMLDLTQQILANQVGCARITLRRIENGALKPSKQLALILLAKLDIPERERPQWVAFARGLASLPTKQADIFSTKQITNIPTQITTFIGREKEQVEVIKLIKKHRLITLTGSGGIGKTRLSLKLGEQLLENYADGVWLVELAAINDPALLPQTAIKVLGITTQSDTPLIETLIEFLRAKEILIILDNCEHLLDACAQFTDAVLKNCPRLKILATSREPLGITGEAIYRVPSLGLPHVEQMLEKFRDFESVCLFEERAQLAQTDFSLTLENASFVAQICSRLDGIPLAIELAAAKVYTLSPKQIAEQLDESFNLLTGGSRTALPRQQTIRTSIEWSWGLLTEPERTYMSQLSVFAGGWTLESAQAICDGNILNLTDSLVKKSLIVSNQEAGNKTRYRFHETIRQYARTKLIENNEADTACQRHAEHYLALVEETGLQEINPAIPPAQLDQIEVEHDNLRAALAWTLSSGSAVEIGYRLTAAMEGFWVWRGYSNEYKHWVGLAIACLNGEQAPFTKARARVLLMAGADFDLGKNYATQMAFLSQSLEFFQTINDRASTAYALFVLGWLAREHGDPETACLRLEESLTIYQEIGDKNGVQLASITLGEVVMMLKDTTRATLLLKEGLILARQVEDIVMTGWALNHLGHVAQLQGEYEPARQLHLESLNMFNKIGTRNIGAVWAHQSLGEIALEQNEATLAMKHFMKALELSRVVGEIETMAWCLAGLAGVAAIKDEPERATRLWGAAEALRQSIGTRFAPAAHKSHERLQSNVRKQLGDTIFNVNWTEGHSMSQGEILAIVEEILQ